MSRRHGSNAAVAFILWGMLAASVTADDWYTDGPGTAFTGQNVPLASELLLNRSTFRAGESLTLAVSFEGASGVTVFLALSLPDQPLLFQTPHGAGTQLVPFVAGIDLPPLYRLPILTLPITDTLPTGTASWIIAMLDSTSGAILASDTIAFTIAAGTDTRLPEPIVIDKVPLSSAEESIAARSTSAINADLENLIAKGLVETAQAEHQAKVLYNAFFMLNPSATRTEWMKHYTALTKAMKILDAKYTNLLALHTTVESRQRPSGQNARAAARDWGRLNWYLEHYGETTPGGVRISLETIAKQNQVTVSQAHKLLLNHHGRVAAENEAEAAQTAVWEGLASDVEKWSDYTTATIGMVTGGQAMYGAYTAYKSYRLASGAAALSRIAGSAALKAKIAEVHAGTLRPVVTGALQGAWDIASNAVNLYGTASGDTDWQTAAKVMNVVTVGKTLGRGLYIVGGADLGMKKKLLLFADDVFLTPSNVNDTLALTKNVIHLITDPNGQVGYRVDQLDSATWSAALDHFDSSATDGTFLPNGSYTVIDPDGREHSFSVTRSGAGLETPELPGSERLIDDEGDILDALLVSLPESGVATGSGSVVVTATTSGGTAPYQYAWTVNDLAVTATGPVITAGSAIAGTTYALAVTVTDAAGQTDTASLTVVVTENSLPVSLGGNRTTTSGQALTITPVITGGTAPFTHVWTFDGGYAGGGTTYTVGSDTVAGTYVIGLTVTDALGAQGTDSITVTVAPSTGGDVPTPPATSITFTHSGPAGGDMQTELEAFAAEVASWAAGFQPYGRELTTAIPGGTTFISQLNTDGLIFREQAISGAYTYWEGKYVEYSVITGTTTRHGPAAVWEDATKSCLIGRFCYSHDALHGVLTLYHNDGTPAQERVYINGKIEGYAASGGPQVNIYNYADGQIADGPEIILKQESDGSYRLSNVYHYRVERGSGWSSGRYHGYFASFNQDGSPYYAGNYVVDTASTPWTSTREGTGVQWLQNGGKKMTTHVAGKLQGPTKAWYADGQLTWTGQYANGEEDGVWMYYNEDGSLRETKVWDNGIVVSTTTP